jgi:putative MATE family efflux protein
MKKTTYTYAEIGKIAYPIFLMMFVQNLIQVIDTAFLGHVGEIELGASAIGGVYYIAIFTVAFGFSTGAQILIGRRNGEKKFDQIGGIFLFGTVFLWIVALLIFFFTRWSSETFLARMLHSPNVLKASTEFLHWRIGGLFFAAVNVMFRAFFVGIIRTKVLTFNAICMALTNVFFDYVLIFGKWGFPEMGISGAALALVLSEAVSTGFFVIYLIVSVDLKKYGFIGISWKNFRVVMNILNVSISLMIQNFLSLSSWLFFFFAIESMGEATLASSNIIRSFYMLFGIPAFALSSTASTLVSNTIGAGKSNEVISLIWKIARLALAISAILAIVLFLFPEPVLRIYTTNTELIKSSIPSLYVIVIVILTFSVGNVFFQSVSGTGNTRSALLIESFTLVIYVLWMWFTAIHLKAPLAVCWTVEWVYAFVLGLFSFAYFRYAKWQNKKI